MDHHNNDVHPIMPAFNLALSFLSTIFAFITLHDVQVVVTLIASGVACISGFFAARYYYYSTKKLK